MFSLVMSGTLGLFLLSIVTSLLGGQTSHCSLSMNDGVLRWYSLELQGYLVTKLCGSYNTLRNCTDSICNGGTAQLMTKQTPHTHHTHTLACVHTHSLCSNSCSCNNVMCVTCLI